MPTWTPQQFNDYLTRRQQQYKARGETAGASVQEFKAHIRQAPRHVQERQSANGDDHLRFRISIALRYAGRQRRDIDGAASTLLDCLMAARRRLLDVFAGTDSEGTPVG